MVAVKQCRLWLLGWRDANASLCSGLLAAMPRRLGPPIREEFGRYMHMYMHMYMCMYMCMYMHMYNMYMYMCM